MNVYVLLGTAVFLGSWLFLLFKPEKFLFLKQWQRIGAALLALVLTVLLFHQARESAPERDQLLYACWRDYQAMYVDSSETRCDPEPIHNAGPGLKVEWRLDGDSDVHKDSLKLAIDFWNDELGYQAFVEAKPGERADVEITNCGGLTNPMTTSHFKGDDGELSALICVRWELHDLRFFYLALAHELGHVLGLDHDPGGSSIMRPDVLEADQDGMRVWIVTSGDRKLLRKISANR